MSTALNKAIYQRLSGTEVLTGAALTAQTALIAMLGHDRNKAGTSLGPAVLIGNVDDACEFPQITFRRSGGRESLDGHDFAIRADVYYDFEYWAKGRAGVHTVEQIDQYVEKLIDRSFRIAPLMSLESGELFFSDALTEMTPGYDRTGDLQFGLRRFRFVEARYQ